MPTSQSYRMRRGTAAQWTAVDPVLASGEAGYETDTGKQKVGDGTTAWSSLPYSGSSDATQLSRLNDTGTEFARWSAGQATIDYQDSTETQTNFSALPAVSNNQQVSGNKLYSSTTSTNPACSYIPFAVAAGQKFNVQTFFDYTGASAGTAIYLGIDTLPSGNTTNVANQPDAISIGLTAAGAQSGLAGTNVSSAISAPGTTTTWTASAGRYSVTVCSDGDTIAFGIGHTTDPTKTYTWSFPASALVTMGKTIGRIMLYCGDSRGLSGHSIGPVVTTLGSLQPTRTKTVSSFGVGNIAHRHFARIAVSSSDTWRWQLPATYDPRQPAPLAIYLHPARTSQVVMNRPWIDANLTALTDALGDAGYIVASAKDGYNDTTNTGDRYGNQASMDNYLDLYKYMRSKFSISSTVLWGDSMAGLTGANILARRTIPNIAAAYFICPSIDLDYPHQNATYSPDMDTAYGVGGGVTWAQASAGYNPMKRPGQEFRGVPVRIVYATSDTIAPHANHGALWLPKVSPYAPEASSTSVAGGHLAAAAYSSTDLMAFLDRNVPRTT